MPAKHRSEASSDSVCVGQVVAAHGLRGELKVESFSDFEERFAVGSQCQISVAPYTLTVESCRSFREFFLVQFAEVRDRSKAESLRGLLLEIPENEMGRLSSGSFWVHDIIGMSVETESGESLGWVTQIIGTGANDVFEIAADPSLSVSERILLPAIAEVIRKVDIQAGRLVVRLLPGLVK